MDNFDKILQNKLQNDKLNTKPSEEVFNHLRNQMLVNSATSHIKQNSFLPLFTSMAGRKNIVWKISIAAVFLISFFGIKQINKPDTYIQIADSTNLHQNIDTLNFQLADSNFTY
jgi:hypothetical protein